MTAPRSQRARAEENDEERPMDLMPNRSSRRRRRKRTKPAQPSKAEPILIVARRPDSPRLEKPTRRMKAASAKPRSVAATGAEAVARTGPSANGATRTPAEERTRRREARIVQAQPGQVDENERERLRLLSHLMDSEGRSAISRAAEKYFAAGFALPEEQEVQLKLLEHFDEGRARDALEVLSRLIADEKPKQVPVFDQRLRRLEEYADEAATRTAAAELRRALRA